MTVPNNSNTYLPGVIAIPSSLMITGITQSNPMVVTVSVNSVSEADTYIPGQLVKLTVPVTYKMIQADGLIGQVLDNTGLNITLNIDSSLFDAFVVPSGNVIQPASFAPSGSRNLAFSNSTNQIGFQSLNNTGN
jgi:hypothetical protein